METGHLQPHPACPPHTPVGMDSGDRGRERVGEGVPTTRLLRFPLRQLLGEVGIRSDPGLLAQRTTCPTGSPWAAASGPLCSPGGLPHGPEFGLGAPGPASPASVFTIPLPELCQEHWQTRQRVDRTLEPTGGGGRPPTPYSASLPRTTAPISWPIPSPEVPLKRQFDPWEP